MPVPSKKWPNASNSECFENFTLYALGGQEPRMWFNGSWVGKETKLFKLAEDGEWDKAKKLLKLCDKMADVHYDFETVKKLREENSGLF